MCAWIALYQNKINENFFAVSVHPLLPILTAAGNCSDAGYSLGTLKNILNTLWLVGAWINSNTLTSQAVTSCQSHRTTVNMDASI